MVKKKPSVSVGSGDPKDIPEELPMSIMRVLVEMYYDFQKTRIEAGNRALMNAERNNITEEDLEKYGVKDIFDAAKKFEGAIQKRIEADLPTKAIFKNYLDSIQGIGPILTAGCMAYVEDVSRFGKVSALWQYSGYGQNTFCPDCSTDKTKAWTYVDVEYEGADGKKKKVKRLRPSPTCNKCGHDTENARQQNSAGFQSNWNPKIKVLFWKAATSFMKQQSAKSGYRKLYEQYKRDLRSKFPSKIKDKNGKTKYNDGHINNMALRKVSKIFMQHVWIVWRQIDGHPISKPYGAIGANHTYLEPFVDKPNKEFDKILKEIQKNLKP